ncbi:MAG: hypothetical protein IPK13_17005 [Deltaproteobacteria bacterium]|nr:hypothetical protein [Deltaproteobacteria bacterium]
MKKLVLGTVFGSLMSVLVLAACGGTEADDGLTDADESAARAAGYSVGGGSSTSCSGGAFGYNCGRASSGSSSYGSGSGSTSSGGYTSGGSTTTSRSGTRGYNSTCGQDSDCISSLVCRTGRCLNLGGINSTCSRDSECISSLVCNSVTARCANLGGNYTRCGRDADCLSTLSCNYRGYCSAY